MRAATQWTPGREISVLHRELDDMLGRFFGEANGSAANRSDGASPVARNLRWVPAIESFMREDDLIVRADLPGIDPNQVDITVEGDRLSIRGERRDDKTQTKDGRVYREVHYGSFERNLTLPWDVDPETVQATYKDGVLEVTMKTPQKVLPKKIQVNAAS